MEDAQITAIQLFGLSSFSFFLMETTAVDADATVDVVVSNPALNKGCPLRAALKYAYDLL